MTELTSVTYSLAPCQGYSTNDILTTKYSTCMEHIARCRPCMEHYNSTCYECDSIRYDYRKVVKGSESLTLLQFLAMVYKIILVVNDKKYTVIYHYSEMIAPTKVALRVSNHAYGRDRTLNGLARVNPGTLVQEWLDYKQSIGCDKENIDKILINPYMNNYASENMILKLTDKSYSTMCAVEAAFGEGGEIARYLANIAKVPFVIFKEAVEKVELELYMSEYGSLKCNERCAS